MGAVGFLALLRGINVGGKNKLPMRPLAQLFVEAGCENVQTFIQSGNVVFTATADVADLSATISRRIAEQYAIRVPVQIHRADQLRLIVADNPYRAAGIDEARLHVAFLADPPALERIAMLDPNRSPPDTFLVRGRAIYLHLPNGVADSKLTNAYFDAKLATISTVRNWRSVTKLAAMLDDLSP